MMYHNKNLVFYILLFIPSIIYATETSYGFDSDESSTWIIGEEMPTPRTEILADAVGEKIYVMGGADYSKSSQGTRMDKVEIFDTQKNIWITSAKPMPVAIDHGVAVAYNNKIYVVGGFIEGRIPTNKLFIYDTIKDEWQEGKPMSTPRAALTAQFINGTLYAVGGSNSSLVPVSTNEAYNPETNTWTTKAPMPTARHHLASAVIDGKLYALGGRILGDGVPSWDIKIESSNFNRNEMYDPQTDKWTVKEPMLDKISGFGATSANDEIYVFGGANIKEYLDRVEKYNPLTDKWTYEPSMTSGRIGFHAVTVDNKIYTVGGQIVSPESSETGLIPLNTNEILDLKTIDANSKIN